MSLAQRIQQLDAVRDALVTAVNNKGGSLPENATLYDVVEGVNTLPTGGGSDSGHSSSSSGGGSSSSSSHSGGGGGGGTSSVAVVDAYVPGFLAISDFWVSGLTDHSEDGGHDLTPANGHYELFTGTLPQERVYKHVSQNYYIYYVPEDEEMGSYSSGWGLFSSTGQTALWGAYLYTTAQTLSAGTSTWSDEMGMASDSITLYNVTGNTVLPAITIRRMISYSSTTNQYTFSAQQEVLHAFETEPIPHYIYVINDSSLIGDYIGNEGGNQLFTYVPGHDTPPVVQYGNNRNSQYWYGLNAWSFPSLKVEGETVDQFSVITYDGVVCLYNPNSTEAKTGDFGPVTSERLRMLPKELNRHWSCAAAFHYGNQTSKKQRILKFESYSSGGIIAVDIDWTAATPYVTVSMGGSALASTTPSAALRTGWHHAALVYDYDTKDLKLYLDGTLVATAQNISYERAGYFSDCIFGVGDTDGAYCIGHLCELKLWSMSLTPAMVSAEYTRVSALWAS